MERNDSRYVENVGVSFAIYCDEAGLSVDEGLALAENIAHEVEYVAEDRRDDKA